MKVLYCFRCFVLAVVSMLGLVLGTYVQKVSARDVTPDIFAGVPSHFVETGYFSPDRDYANTPFSNFIKQDILYPLAPLAATSFALGFTYRFLADRLQSHWITALGAPLSSLALHFFLRPKLDKNTLLRLLPGTLDTALTVAKGPQWAGWATPVLRTAGQVAAYTEAALPELQRELQSFQRCAQRPVFLHSFVNSPVALLSCLPDDLDLSTDGMALLLDVKSLDVHRRSEHDLDRALVSLAKTASEQGVDTFLIVPTKAGLRVIPSAGSNGWLLGWLLSHNTDHDVQWWTDVELDQAPEGTLLKSPLSVEVIRAIERHVGRNGEWSDRFASDNTPPELFVEDGIPAFSLHQGAGLSVLPISENLALWIKQPLQSLLPFSLHTPLPDVAVQHSEHMSQDHLDRLDAYRVKHVIPERLSLVWRLMQLWMASHVSAKSAAVGESAAANFEELLVFPGMYFPQGARLQGRMIETVRVDVEEGLSLEGVLVKADSQIPKNERKLLIFFHGNGTNSHDFGAAIMWWKRHDSRKFSSLCREHGVDVLFPGYRGYGNELFPRDSQTFLDDANRFYQQFQRQYRSVVVAGHSLGSGAATWVAAQNNPEALILISPFYNLLNVGREMLSPRLPEWVMKYNIRNDVNIKGVRAYIHIIHGQDDVNIRPHHSEQLFQDITKLRGEGGAVRWTPVGGTHNNFLEYSDIWDLFSTLFSR